MPDSARAEATHLSDELACSCLFARIAFETEACCQRGELDTAANLRALSSS